MVHIPSTFKGFVKLVRFSFHRQPGLKPVRSLYPLLLILGLLSVLSGVRGQLPWRSSLRTDQLLDNNWRAVSDSSGARGYQGFEQPGYNAGGWKVVQLPHNFDDYGGYIRDKHGNRHGDGWYRKYFTAGPVNADQAAFLFFEGVSSYATVYLNGHLIGKHAGGRTSFTMDVTPWLKRDGTDNLLAVKVAHPAGIRDLPWVCGGCSDEVGFSEGSQPFGIFRPVHLIKTGKVRIVPFGVHIYNDTTVTNRQATLFLETTLQSYQSAAVTVQVEQQLLDKNGKPVASGRQTLLLDNGRQKEIKTQLQLRGDVHLWSLESPYLYHLKTRIVAAKTGLLLDELETPYGIRWIKWPAVHQSGQAVSGARQFLLNGRPVFINGIAGYEHALGKSHAFTAEEIATRVAMIRSMGFNAFRDAHQPHNLRYQYYWDKDGVLWWPQFSAHIWFDTPAFRTQFLRLLKDWVLERRNSPSNIMWGLQNESQLPADFARECVRLIRSLDPTASTQRLITTCNGGEGTDWNVPQNWSGTYGGDPDTYGADLKKELLVGEYGGWRTLDLHTEDGFKQKGPYSIESWTALLEKKIRLAYQVRDSVCGQFLWVFNSHDNPGRVQAAEGYRDLDRIGPVNYKGLLTSWEEPTEAVYLYQSNFTSADTAPMVHIASHEWADRWLNNKQQKDIIVYSNCDSVQLYNGLHQRLLGTRTRGGVGTHFTWKNMQLQYGILYAVGYYKGLPRVTDQVRLNNLPVAPELLQKKAAVHAGNDLLAPEPGYTYLYRYNCGGPAYQDHLGNVWSSDRSLQGDTTRFGSESWTADYKGLPAFFASQRRISDFIQGTRDEALFRTFRYGREKLDFNFPVPDGVYRVELFFAEPWWGIGNKEDCSGWRDFDVAVNDKVAIHHLDIFKAAGGALKALKKTVEVEVHNGHIRINFPETYSGQGIIAAIAIARKNTGQLPVPAAAEQAAAVLSPVSGQAAGNNRSAAAVTAFDLQDWLDLGDTTRLMTELPSGRKQMVAVHITGLPPALFGASWLQWRGEKSGAALTAGQPAWLPGQDLNVYVGVHAKDLELVRALKAAGYTDTHTTIEYITAMAGDLRSAADSLQVYIKKMTKGTALQPSLWWTDCLLAVKPVSHMQPPYDQKPEISYEIQDAVYNKNEGSPHKRAGKNCVLFTGQGASSNGGLDAISWPLVTGVADFHSFQVKFAYAGTDSLAATLSLVAADGKVMATAPVWLTPTKEGKWNSCYLLTPTMINAGRYRLTLTWKRAAVPVCMYSMKLR